MYGEQPINVTSTRLAQENLRVMRDLRVLRGPCLVWRVAAIGQRLTIAFILRRQNHECGKQLS